MSETPQSKQNLSVSDSKFALRLATVITFLVALPTLLNWIFRPTGSLYLGIQYNFDDHMVYLGWMHQAMEGKFLFENRFTTDPQPGLTIHLWFLILGWAAKLIGLPLAALVARLLTTFFSVILLSRLIAKVTETSETRRLSLLISVFGAGLGHLTWQTFGWTFTKSSPLQFLFGKLLPIDNWQPEAFFLPSALTNGLFMISLMLILGTFSAILEAKDSWKPVLPGAICFGILMNIHSYDALLVTSVLIGFLIALISSGRVDRDWVVRACVIGSGALAPALWFVYVLKNDTVFLNRAATETYSAPFQPVLFGLLLLVIVGLIAIAKDRSSKQKIGLWMYLGLMGLLFVKSFSYQAKYFLDLGLFGVAILVLYSSLYLLFRADSEESSQRNSGRVLIECWALCSLIIPYFPALFQRKLFMMTAIPWAILAAIAGVQLLQKQELSQRRLIAILGFILIGASNLRWISRELQLGRLNVSNTGVHTVYLDSEVQELLSKVEGRDVVIAAPASGLNPSLDEAQNPIPDQLNSPIVPDLNPVFVGLRGTRAYAGHWSETPEYSKRRQQMLKALIELDFEALKSLGVTHAVLSVPMMQEKSLPQDLDIFHQGSKWIGVKL